MQDAEEFLNSKEVNKTFEQLYSEKSVLFTNQDDIYNSIIESSMKGRGLVDQLYKTPQ